MNGLKVLLAVGVAMVALVLIDPGTSGKFGVYAQVANRSDCNSNTKPNDTSQWDHCPTSGSGTYPSKSYCYSYADPTTNQTSYVYMYDCYKCSNGFMYRFNCTQGSTDPCCMSASS